MVTFPAAIGRSKRTHIHPQNQKTQSTPRLTLALGCG
jgi:hypothetical protein